LVTNILLALIIVFMLFAIGFGVFFYTQTNKSINDSKEDKYSVSEEKKKSKKKAKEDEVISTDGLPGVNSYLPGTGTELPNATAENRENVIPLEFTDGFEKAEYDKYNSRATDNGLKGTLIYFTGELKEIELIENSGSNTIFGYVTDYAGHKWMVCMNSEQYVAGDYYDEYIGKEVCVRGRYNGYAVDFECPFVFLDELYIVGSGERVNGAMKYE